MRLTTLGIGSALALAGVLALAHAESPPSQAPAPSYPKPDYRPPKTEKRAARYLEPKHVSERTRNALRRKMAHHGKEMRELFEAVVLLDYPAAQRHAHRMAAEPRVARSSGAADELAGLKESFYVFQDELRARAAQVEGAAKAEDAVALGRALAELTANCVGCHHAYMTP